MSYIRKKKMKQKIQYVILIEKIKPYFKRLQIVHISKPTGSRVSPLSCQSETSHQNT